MCFEFEWLYWAQLAQEEERRRTRETAQAREQQAGPRLPQPQPAQEPAHA